MYAYYNMILSIFFSIIPISPLHNPYIIPGIPLRS